MPPPIPEHVKRYTANPSRPARYRPGKAVPEDEPSDDEDDEEEEEDTQKNVKPPRRLQTRQIAPVRPLPQQDEDEDDEDGFITDEDDDEDGGVPVVAPVAGSSTQQSQVPPQGSPAQLASGRILSRAAQVEDDDEEESESEDDSEGEDDSSSEEETPRRKFQRPTFIRKTDRKQSDPAQPDETEAENATPAPRTTTSQHTEDVTARRLAEAESMIKATIERDTAARLAGKKSWDDDDLLPEALVDDTDGIDPEAEHSAWRLREMHRLKRDREAMIAREKELEEIERRRNLSAAEREAEDHEFIAKQKAEKEEGRGQSSFLSKYHHKGAFFMDDETSARLAKRDLAGARFVDDIADKSTLPEYMRMRDMTKLGKKGRTRYTDLKGQDTGRFGDELKKWRGSGYTDRNGGRNDDLKGVDERFLPDADRGPRASGANASAVGERRARRRSRSRSKSDEERRHRRRSYSGSRSRSPPRKSRRQRSPSPYRDRDRIARY